MKFRNLILLPLAILFVSCMSISEKDAKLIEASGRIVPNKGTYVDESFASQIKLNYNFKQNGGSGKTYHINFTAFTICAPSTVDFKMPKNSSELKDFEKSYASYILDKSENSLTLKSGATEISNFKNAGMHVWLEDGVYKPSAKGVGLAVAASLENFSDTLKIKTYISYLPMVNLTLFAPKVSVKNLPKDIDEILIQSIDIKDSQPSFNLIYGQLTSKTATSTFSTPISYMNANYNDGKSIVRTIIFAEVK